MSRTKRSTSHDVAKLSGVSVTTVSYVVNNKTDGNVRISDATRKRVMEAVLKLNYRPMSAARALRTKRSNSISLMIPFIETPFQPLFISAIQREAEKAKLEIIIYGTRDDLWREKEYINVLIARDVDGVIIHSHKLQEEDIDRLVQTGISVVISGNSPRHPLADNVMIDEAGAAEEAVSFLIAKGHRRIGMISGSKDTWSGRLRMEGYCRALAAHQIDFQPELIEISEYFQHNAGEQAMSRLLSLQERPTAVFAASDAFAVEALLYAHDRGLVIPQDLAIVGFDNTREAVRVRPKLTTVQKDVDLMAANILRCLLERIHQDEPMAARLITLDHQFIQRDSA